MGKIIRVDLYRYGAQTNLLKGLKESRCRYLFSHRKASKYKPFSLLALIYKLILRRLGYKYGFKIPINTQIGEGFFIGHFGTIVINGDVKIDKNFYIAI